LFNEIMMLPSRKMYSTWSKDVASVGKIEFVGQFLAKEVVVGVR